MIKCTKCFKLKHANDFSLDKKKVNGLKSQCKECRNKYLREYRRNKRLNDREWVKKTNNSLRNFFKKNPGKTKQYYKTKTKEQHIRYSLKHSYGITLEKYNEMLLKQNEVCAICKNRDIYMDKTGQQFYRRLAVDHCHESGKIRGLLCSGCNGGLGLFRDDYKLLEQAIIYLNKDNN